MNNFIDLLPKWSSVVIWGIVLMIYFFIGFSTLIGQEDIKPDNRWSGESITLYTTLQGLSMIDAKQTFMMDEYRSYFDEIEPISYAHEVNPLMGESPTSDRIVVVKLLSGVLTFYGLNKMKEKNRKKVLMYLKTLVMRKKVWRKE